jgi:Phospholipase_D-nuclease N-terminal
VALFALSDKEFAMHFDWDSFWGLVWYSVVIFAFIAYLIILFNIITDLFWRDHKTSGVVKAVWVVFLIVFPYLTALVYLIARGNGMAQRARDAAAAAKQQTDDYIKQAAGRSPAGPPRRRSRRPRHCWTPARSRRPSSTR